MNLEQVAEQLLKAQLVSSYPLGGGCINKCFHLRTSNGDFFLKYNDANRYPGMFASEAKGLELLRKQFEVIPKVVTQEEVNDTSVLVLEWIEAGRRKTDFWKEFGSNLAKMHASAPSLREGQAPLSKTYGLDHDNYIGSLKQSNKQSDDWIDFFIHQRLLPQIELAETKRLLHDARNDVWEKLFKELPSLIPDEPPALLHGDLWNGNFLVNKEGHAALVDPAVYYGHREMDLSMSLLFGGFDDKFYIAYDEVYPLQPGFEERKDLYNLYPLLVHVNLFGGGYVGQVKSVLKRYA